MLAYKCINGTAPVYLQNLLTLKKPLIDHKLQSSSDNSLLMLPQNITLNKSKSMFQYSAPKVWNSLPVNIRECDNLCQFKSALKRHYFVLAFEDVPDLHIN